MTTSTSNDNAQDPTTTETDSPVLTNTEQADREEEQINENNSERAKESVDNDAILPLNDVGDDKIEDAKETTLYLDENDKMNKSKENIRDENEHLLCK